MTFYLWKPIPSITEIPRHWSKNLYFSQKMILSFRSPQLKRLSCLSETFSSTKFCLKNARIKFFLEIGLNYPVHFQYWSLRHRRTKLKWKLTSGACEQSTTKECWLLCHRNLSLDGRRRLCKHCKHLDGTSRTVQNVQIAFGEDIYSGCLRIRVIPYFYICLAHSVSGKIVVSTHCSRTIWKQTFMYPLQTLFIRLGSVGTFFTIMFKDNFVLKILKINRSLCTVQSNQKYAFNIRCVSIHQKREKGMVGKLVVGREGEGRLGVKRE